MRTMVFVPEPELTQRLELFLIRLSAEQIEQKKRLITLLIRKGVLLSSEELNSLNINWARILR